MAQNSELTAERMASLASDIDPASGTLSAVRRLSTSAHRSSSTSITTHWKTSAESIWFSMFLGDDIEKRSAGVIRAGGTLVTIAGPTEARPSGGGADPPGVVVPDRIQLSELVQWVRDGRLRTNIGNMTALDDAVAAFNPTKRIKGKTIIRAPSVRTRDCLTPTKVQFTHQSRV